MKAAAEALEGGDHALAQAIVDGANITLPNGNTHFAFEEFIFKTR